MSYSEPEAHQSPKCREHLLGLSLIWLTVAFVYSQTFRLPYFISEHAMFYAWNNDMSAGDVLAAYNPFMEGWYRPTAFYTSYKIWGALLGWHNIFGFQVLSVAMLGFIGTLTYFLSLRFAGWAVAVFAGAMAAMHPVLYMLAADIIYFDAYYILACLLAMLVLVDGLDRGSKWRIWSAFALFVFSLTCKEQAVALAGAIAVIVAERIFIRRSVAKSVGRHALVMAGLSIVLGIAFAAVRTAYQNAMSGEYRNATDLSVIAANLPAAILWPFRVFAFDTPSWPDIDNLFHPLAALLGIASVVAVAAYLMLEGLRRNRARSILLLSLIAGFSVLPIYSGGRPWHFALPAIFVMLLLGIALESLLRRLRLSPPKVLLVIGAAFVLLSIHDFDLDRQRRMEMNRINDVALRHPPLPASAIPPNATISYLAPGVWAFGNGNLFEWVYLRPDIKDLQFQSLNEISPQLAKGLLGDDKLFYFEWDFGQSRWYERTPQFRDLLKELSGNGEFRLDRGVIDFSAGGNAAAFVQEGWSGPEEFGTWTEGPVAVLRLPVHGVREAVKVEMRVLAFTPPSDIERRICIMAGEQVLLEWVLRPQQANDDGILEFTIPADEIRDRDVLNLQIRIENPLSPSDFSDSRDTRKLGIYVYHIRFQSARDPQESLDE